ncbi:ATP-dependent helicase [Nocardioides jiangxiensis]|uniref:DNA 3'-5' helicase n=1 Tax=Nocardioides jiangxiensis TaxID=3064524 RepID=A0ABT9AZI5_9ACTN|nr:ATP-dependent DNA helicase [Nocardioides sp. WY-20]MDO7867434.1 ATP-dependent DNA helicase [Nocardioides sp. WY-20]
MSDRVGHVLDTAPTYRLVPPSSGGSAVLLDEAQQRVVDHAGGPLLVLAGPGTGKTTTLVEAIATRIERDGVSPGSILALTFSRKAAEQLRDRVTARIGRTTTATMCSTFHSFAYGLIRAHAPKELYDAPLRLLSAPEQDVVLRELLADHPESVRWPDSLRGALGTRGFAREVQAVLGRAREKGLAPDDLAALGRDHGLPAFVAAGAFLEQYLTILDAQGATDYADLIRRATIEAEAHRAELRERFTHVFVDEYQDTDPGQVALLQALAGDGRSLTVVGDPHQSIYAFRGAEVRGILEFPTAFPQASGEPAEVIALATTRRFGPRLLRASQAVASRLSLQGSIPVEAREAFLAPRALPGPFGDGQVEVRTFDSERAEAEHLADLLRRAHLEDGIGWDEMAVLVRSGRSSIPALRRSLGAAGVPVEVASDDLPLVRDPAVLPLLDALRAVVHLDDRDPESVEHVGAARAEALLTGPLGGLDAGDARRLARALRAREKAMAAEAGRPARSSRELIRLAVVEPGFLDGLAVPEAARARALSDLLVTARAQTVAGATAEEVLWTLWDGTAWPARLRRGVEAGGGSARRAHRDLDAICALFEAAARVEEQRDHTGVATFLSTLVAQEIPGDTMAERGVRGAAVRLLTAHRSKGLEWRLVVVAHVQEDGWPDLRRRSSLLGADLIGADPSGAPVLQPPVTTRELLMEERRLFYVACTRAQQRLVVTAVQSSDDEGEQPSRFLTDLFPLDVVRERRDSLPIHHLSGRPRRPLSLGGMVAELRRMVADPEAPEPLRDAAARRLARLAAEGVALADPSSWWGTRAASFSSQPVRESDQPVPVSASMLESVLACPMAWFLEREAGGAGASHQSANLGQLVHALAEGVAAGDLTPDLEVLMEHVDAVWGRLAFRTPWSAAREHERVRNALVKFLAWHAGNPRELLGTEVRFSAEVEIADGERVRLTGYADRLELDAAGRVVVVDLKTGRSKPTGPAVERHTQLALYQYAVDAGAIEGVTAGSGGAELVQLGLEDGLPEAQVQRQAQHAPDGPERSRLREHLAYTATLVRDEQFPALTGQHCDRCAFTAICPAKSAGSVVTR